MRIKEKPYYKPEVVHGYEKNNGANILYKTIEKLTENKWKFFMVIDQEKGRIRVSREILKWTLKKRGLPKNEYNQGPIWRLNTREKRLCGELEDFRKNNECIPGLTFSHYVFDLKMMK